jgi:hypothetical protein
MSRNPRKVRQEGGIDARDDLVRVKGIPRHPEIFTS